MTAKRLAKPFHILRTLLIIAGIIFSAGYSINWIRSSEPSVQRESAERTVAMPVEVVRLQQENYFPRIEVLGRVTPAQDIVLSPRVAGQISDISEQFIPGSILQSGQVILKIDASDYQNTVQKMESNYQTALSEFDIERGRADVARKEYEILDQNLSVRNRALILRDPQKAAASAAVKTAKAELDQARVELERTSVKVPFDAQVISRNVNIGSQVNSGTELARLIGTDEYWVVATLPTAQLAYLDTPKNDGQGAEVVIRSPRVWPHESYRTGRVISLVGALEESTRMARLIISVKDPLALKDTALPALLIDSIVHAEINGKPLQNVFRIQRDHLHEGDTVWLNRNSKLHIAHVSVLLKDKDYVYIADGINNDDLLITSSLATVAEGIELKIDSEASNQSYALTGEQK